MGTLGNEAEHQRKYVLHVACTHSRLGFLHALDALDFLLLLCRGAAVLKQIVIECCLFFALRGHVNTSNVAATKQDSL